MYRQLFTMKAYFTANDYVFLIRQDAEKRPLLLLKTEDIGDLATLLKEKGNTITKDNFENSIKEGMEDYKEFKSTYELAIIVDALLKIKK